MNPTDDKGTVRLSKFTFWYLTPLCYLYLFILFCGVIDTFYLYILGITRKESYQYAQIIIFIISFICSTLIIAYTYRAYKMHLFNKFTFKRAWIPYVITTVLVGIYVVIHNILGGPYEDQNEHLKFGYLFLSYCALPYTFAYIFFRNIIDNWGNPPKILKSISILPWIYFGTIVLLFHLLVGINENENAKFAIFVYLIICSITSTTLYIIGWLIGYVKNK